ncbi:MAG: hypothetical protein GY862_23920 [Gammaproteobacteria bacterium]|nr:hypothetical protein [Gammaproteobacteria bacterium]
MNTYSLISRVNGAYAAVRRFFGFPLPIVPAERVAYHQAPPSTCRHPSGGLRVTALRFVACCLWFIAHYSQAATDCTQVTEIPQIECEALVALYNSTDGANWRDAATNSWNTNNTPCSWTDVTCNEGSVSELTRHNKFLSGSIPAELGNLTNLTKLFLITDHLSGAIPVELGNLTNLTHLALRYLRLSGNIPAELGNMTNLTSLALDGLDLSGSIPAELGNLSNLTSLNLVESGVSGSIPAELGNLTNLTHLELSLNQFSGGIPVELGNLTNLTQLELGYNQLSGSIPVELGNLTNLTHLYLSNNQFSGSIPAELENLTNLTYLYLSNNQFSGSIPAELGNLTNLMLLSLRNNQLSGIIPALPSNLENTLLSRNAFTGETADTATLKDPDWADTQTVAPDNVSATALSDTNIQVSWTPITYTYTNTPGSPKGYYQTYHATLPGGPYTPASGTTTDKSASAYTVSGLSSNTTYYFVVNTYTPAHGANINALTSLFSSEVSATTWPGPPAAPSHFTARAVSPAQVNLNWAYNGDDETGFKIERPAGIPLFTTVADVLSYVDSGVVCETTYEYTIKTTNKYWDSESLTATATTGACPTSTVSLTITTDYGSGQGTVTAEPDALQDGINCDPDFTDCVGNYLKNTSVTLTATPEPGSVLFSWSGSATACTGTDSNILVLMNADQQCDARFEVAKLLSVSLDEQGTGSGHVESKESGIAAGINCGTTCSDSHPQGDEVSLSAIADTGSVFMGWGGNCSGTETTFPITLNADSHCTAKFNKQTLGGTTLSIDAPPSLLDNAVFSVQGWLVPNPNEGQDLSGLSILLSISGPMEGNVEAYPYNGITFGSGQYIFRDRPGLAIPGTYSIQARFSGSEERGLAASESEMRPLSVGRKAGYALLIQGWTNDLDGKLSHAKTLNRIYDKLLKRGLDKNDIRHLDTFGIDPLSDIQTALTQLKGSMAGSPAPFYLVLVNHGSTEQFHLGNQLLRADKLASLLAEFENGLAVDGATYATDPLSHPRVVLLGFCYSGSFIPALSKAPADGDAGRIIISSAAADEESYKGPREKPEPGEPLEGVPGGEFFMDALFNYLGQSNPAYSLYDAFAQATRLTEQYTRIGSDGTAYSASPFADNAIQHPLLDDNGDGRGSNLLSIISGQDGHQADGIYLGAHLNLTNSNLSITRVTPTRYLEQGQTAVELFAEVSHFDKIASIRADVRKPGLILKRPPTPSFIQLALELDGDYLACDDPLNPKRCSWNSPVFADDEPGMYEVFYSVRDTQGEFAPVKRSVVYKKRPAGQNQPPTVPQLELPSHNPNAACPPAASCPQTALLFDWTDSTDAVDDFTYTLSIALDAGFSNIIYQAEELTESMYGVSTAAKIDDGRNDGSTGLRDQTVYYWKAEAVDSYGEKSSSAVFVFMTSNKPNAAPSIISGRTITEVTRQPLENTTITPPADVNSQVVTSGGSYLMTLPSGRHYITARAPNHQAQTAILDITQQPEIELNFFLLPIYTRTSYQDGVLSLPEVTAGNLAASVQLSLEEPSQLIFKLDSYAMKLVAGHPKPARYGPGLYLPEVQADTELYEVWLIEVSPPPDLKFQVDLEENPPKYLGPAE